MSGLEQLKKEVDLISQQSLDLMAKQQLKEAWQLVEFRYQAIKSALGETGLTQEEARDLIDYIRMSNGKLKMMSQRVNGELIDEQKQMANQRKVNRSYL